MAGPAFTLRYVPVSEVKGTVGDYIDLTQPGDVIVLDNNGKGTAPCGAISSRWWQSGSGSAGP